MRGGERDADCNVVCWHNQRQAGENRRTMPGKAPDNAGKRAGQRRETDGGGLGGEGEGEGEKRGEGASRGNSSAATDNLLQIPVRETSERLHLAE